MLACWGEPSIHDADDLAFDPLGHMDLGPDDGHPSAEQTGRTLSPRELLRLYKVGGMVCPDQDNDAWILRSSGMSRIVHIVTSHPDHDHIIGFDVVAFQVLKAFQGPMAASRDGACRFIATGGATGRHVAIGGYFAAARQAWGELALWNAPWTSVETHAHWRVPVWLDLAPEDALGALPIMAAVEVPAWCADVTASLLAAQHLVETEAKEVAIAATGDMAQLACASSLPAPSTSNVSEEGLVSLVWEGARQSLLVVFTGDGEASFSVKDNGGLFVTVTDFLMVDGLPDTAKLVLETPTVP